MRLNEQQVALSKTFLTYRTTAEKSRISRWILVMVASSSSLSIKLKNRLDCLKRLSKKLFSSLGRKQKWFFFFFSFFRQHCRFAHIHLERQTRPRFSSTFFLRSAVLQCEKVERKTKRTSAVLTSSNQAKNIFSSFAFASQSNKKRCMTLCSFVLLSVKQQQRSKLLHDRKLLTTRKKKKSVDNLSSFFCLKLKSVEGRRTARRKKKIGLMRTCERRLKETFDFVNVSSFF